MHLLVRETRSLDEAAQAVDLGQTGADVVVLSFSDADLGALASVATGRPSLRLASLGRLRHPMSVDLYLEQTASRARCVIVRLLGGLDYWRYGAEELASVCRLRGIKLALLPGDGGDDPALAALSTVAPEAYARLDACFRNGGPANMARALTLAGHLAGVCPDDGAAAEPMDQHGVHTLDATEGRPLAAIVFYRSHLASGDIAPIAALAEALRARGLAVGTLFTASLKAPDSAAFVAATLRDWRPAVVLNATGFSARQDGASPLDAAGVPVLQLVLSGSSREAWGASSQGLSPSDLAMQVVLPELDGRLLTGAVSFKAEEPPDPVLEYGRTLHRPDADGIALAADRAAGWARLAVTPAAQRRIAIVLSDYPGIGGQRGHAVGLDTFASLGAILRMLAEAGYATSAVGSQALCEAPARAFLTVDDYRRRAGALLDAATAAWGAPEDDSSVVDGWFAVPYLRFGNVVALVQPDRGAAALTRLASLGTLSRNAGEGGTRRDSDGRVRGYHDPDQPPRHAYIALYLWLQTEADAIVHLGAHGTLEWLPGKAAALSASCWPRALLGGLPVIYPFIVNNPGEAAAAKRRLGAVTIGHLTPPLRPAGSHGQAAALERMIDEYAAADGLDRRRTTALRGRILQHATDAGLLAECGVPQDAPEDDALARLDAYLCDVKDLQIRDGLHVFATPPESDRRALLCSVMTAGAKIDACAPSERAGLLAALDGRFVQPGPAGAPSAGRLDVLPTGRNLASIDPRAVPTRVAMDLAHRAADELLTRHRQDHGEWPRRLVLNLWGSATMRTGGEDLALALVLLGARPVWDDNSSRVNGFEILPLALLDRPRVDVTLRISGLFRDAFAAQIVLFDSIVAAIADRDEAPDWNPLAGAGGPRIFGPPTGCYGAGTGGDQWLTASAGAYGRDRDGAPDPDALADRVRAADAFLHQQDHAGTDLLDSPEYAAHLGGFAAAAASLGSKPALYHRDGRTRTLAEQIARVVRGRAANPRWLAGMQRHGYRGAAEIARSVEALSAYAATLPDRLDRQFDLLFDATLGDPAIDAFLRQENPDARAAMAARFEQARQQGLWHPRRNMVDA
jgi:cobaltochelatase CobN